MASEWYLRVADREVGPLAPGQLKAMADRGQISPYDPVRLGRDGRWVPASSVRGLLPAGGPSTMEPPPTGPAVAEESEKPWAASGGGSGPGSRRCSDARRAGHGGTG